MTSSRSSVSTLNGVPTSTGFATAVQLKADYEKKYREQRPNLEAQFQKVDAMERRAIAAQELDDFLREGRLGGYGRQP